jgi:hypothetical protein
VLFVAEQEQEDYFDRVQKGWNFDEDYNTPNSGGPIDWAPSRFHVRTENLNEDIYLTLLESDPIKVLEHELTIGDTWNNRFICPEMFGNRCYFCQDVQVENWDGEKVDETPYNLWLLTIINNTGWVNDDGEEFRNVKQVLPMKRSAAKLVKTKMQDVRDEGGDPEFYQFKVRRTGKQKSRIGDDWNTHEQLSPEQLQKSADDELDLEPYDWKDMITVDSVKDYEEQKEIYQSGSKNTPDEILDDVDANGSEGSADQNKDFFDEDSDGDNESSSEESSDESVEAEDEDLVSY